MSLTTPQSLINPGDTLSQRMEKFIDYSITILKTTKQQVIDILEYREEDISKQTLEKSRYFYQLFQAIQALEQGGHSSERILFATLRLDMFELEESYPAGSSRRDIILRGNMRDIQIVCCDILSAYYGDFS